MVSIDSELLPNNNCSLRYSILLSFVFFKFFLLFVKKDIGKYIIQKLMVIIADENIESFKLLIYILIQIKVIIKTQNIVKILFDIELNNVF